MKYFNFSVQLFMRILCREFRNCSEEVVNYEFPLCVCIYIYLQREDQKLEQGLSRARAAIKEASVLSHRNSSSEAVPGQYVYRNAAVFHR